MGWVTFLLTIITLCYLVRRWQIKKIKLYYQPTSKMYTEFVKETGMDKMRYTPWLFALNGHLQGIFYCFTEMCMAYMTKLKFTRQIFEFSDGGETALDFLIHPDREDETPEESRKAERPLMVVIPGLSGETSNMYCLTPAYAALEKDYDLVIVGYRGVSLPIKTPKSYHAANW
jgi:predicted alpha/beta-fold hydrolase